MNNKTYDIIKDLALLWIPLLSTFYFAIAKIWGLPYGTEIVGTLTAVDTALGAIVKYFSNQFNKAASTNA